MDVPPPRTVSTAMGPGYIADTRPAAAIPAMSWVGMTRRLRIVDIPPQSQRASVTYASLEPYEFDKGAWAEAAYNGVKQAARHSIESPHIRREREAES